jgi:hypothetical protein
MSSLSKIGRIQHGVCVRIREVNSIGGVKRGRSRERGAEKEGPRKRDASKMQ